MLEEALNFWNTLKSKVIEVIVEKCQNCLRCERYTVVTSPSDGKIGVKLPLSNNTIDIPYTSEVSGAQPDDTVLVLWWGNSLSTATAWCYGNGPRGSSGGGGGGVFYATYEVTTFDEIREAYESGKTLCLAGDIDGETFLIPMACYRYYPDDFGFVSFMTLGATPIEEEAGSIIVHSFSLTHTRYDDMWQSFSGEIPLLSASSNGGGE